MKPAAIIPFFGQDPTRVQNLQAVQRFYQRDFEIFMGSGETIGEARNNAAFKAIKAGHEHLFFVDADIIIPIKNVLQAIALAKLTGSGVYPYGPMVRMVQAERRAFLERGTLPSRIEGFPEGGALVLSHQGFIEVCGYPQINYGEDNILHNAIRSFLGPIVRIWEPGFHLWHPSSTGSVDTRAVQVVRKTEESVGLPDIMRRIILKAGYHDVARFSAAGYQS